MSEWKVRNKKYLQKYIQIGSLQISNKKNSSAEYEVYSMRVLNKLQ